MDKHLEMEQLISAYYDGEVTLQEKQTVETHIKECTACRAFYSQLKKISSSLSAWSDQDLSPDLEQKIANRILQKGSEKMNKTYQWIRSAVLVVLMVCGVFLAASKVSQNQLAFLKSERLAAKPAGQPIQIAQSGRAGLYDPQAISSEEKLAALATNVSQQHMDLASRSNLAKSESKPEFRTLEGEKAKPALKEADGARADGGFQSAAYTGIQTEDTFASGISNSVLVGDETTGATMDQKIINVDQGFWGRAPSAVNKKYPQSTAVQYEPYYLQNDYEVARRDGKSLLPNKSLDYNYPAQDEMRGQIVGSLIIQEKDRWVDDSYYVPQPSSNTERYEAAVENSFQSALSEPLSTFSIDVDTAAYANIRRFINAGQNPPVDAVRIEEMINYFHYDYPQPEGQEPFQVITEVGAAPWNPQHPLVMIALQGKNVDLDHLPPSNLVFLIDVSGSMNEPNKLPLLKASFKLLVKQLRENDQVAIVTYAGNAGLVLESTSGRDKEKILNAIDSLQPGGSTAGAAGIELAYQIAQRNLKNEGNNRVILATDGDFNVGVSSDEELVRIIEEKRNQGVFLSVLGFGTGNLQDAKMEKLADKGNGNYSYIDNILEGEKVFVHEMGGTLFTIAKDVKIQIEFNPSQVKAYRLLGYENRMLAKEDFNDDFKDAGELGSGHQVTAFYELIPAGSDENMGGVDALKYQQVKEEEKPQNAIIPSNDLLTVKLRYKRTREDQSQLIEKTVSANELNNRSLSENFRFAAAVTEAGLLLKNSRYKAQASYAQVLESAQAAIGKDPQGYRAEFVKLIRMVGIMSEKP